MKIVLIRFILRSSFTRDIPWHFSFYKEILEAQGHSVIILDNHIANLSIEKLVAYVIEQEFDLVATGGIGTVYSPLKQFCVLLKSLNPNLKIIIGGQIVADHEYLLETVPIDIIVLGEGEVTLSKISNAIEKEVGWKTIPGIAYKEDGCVKTNAPESQIDLNDLPDISLENIDIGSYNTSVPENFLIDQRANVLKNDGHKFIYIFLARGCPYKCFFCYRHLSGYRTYSYENLEKIFSYLKSNGFSFIAIGDECITSNKKNLKNICELARKYEIYWTSSGRVNNVSLEILKKIRSYNCVGLQFGIESFDQNMLNAMNKKTIAKQNIKVINWCYQLGMATVLQLIIGTPGEDRDTILNTRIGMWKCYFKFDKIACAILNPYPGSKAYHYGIEKGYIRDKKFLHETVDGKDKLVVNFSKLSNKELYTWQRWLHCEAALNFRVKGKKLLLNRRLLSSIKQFTKAYISLLNEPLNFINFNLYVLKGFKYWIGST